MAKRKEHSSCSFSFCSLMSNTSLPVGFYVPLFRYIDIISAVTGDNILLQIQNNSVWLFYTHVNFFPHHSCRGSEKDRNGNTVLFS